MRVTISAVQAAANSAPTAARTTIAAVMPRALSEESGLSTNTIRRLEHDFQAHPSTIGKSAEAPEVETPPSLQDAT